MNQHAYNLYVHCDGYCVSHDGCDSIEEIRQKFKERYFECLGRKPIKSTIETLVSTGKLFSRNGYSFAY